MSSCVNQDKVEQSIRLMTKIIDSNILSHNIGSFALCFGCNKKTQLRPCLFFKNATVLYRTYFKSPCLLNLTTRKLQVLVANPFFHLASMIYAHAQLCLTCQVDRCFGIDKLVSGTLGLIYNCMNLRFQANSWKLFLTRQQL